MGFHHQVAGIFVKTRSLGPGICIRSLEGIFVTGPLFFRVDLVISYAQNASKKWAKLCIRVHPFWFTNLMR